MVLPGVSADSVIKTQNGYALAVESSNAFRLITTDHSGQIVIDQSYPALGQASTQAVVQADDGSYALAGWVKTSQSGVTDSWLIKTDSSGQKQWSQTFLGIGAYGLLKTSRGGYALTGDHAFLIVTDSMGNIQWKDYYEQYSWDGNKYFNRLQSIIEASPDHFVMAGTIDESKYGQMEAQWLQVSLNYGDNFVAPEITLSQPEEIIYTTRDVPLIFSASEHSEYSNVYLNGYRFLSSGDTTLNNLPNGNYNLTVSSVYSNLNRSISKTINFKVDSDEPFKTTKITINTPANQTYDDEMVTIKFTVDQQTYNAFYSVDGKENQTVFEPLRIASVTLPRGSHTLTVYAQCIMGGPIGSETVNFNVDPSSPTNTPYGPRPSSSPINNSFSQIIQETLQAVTSKSCLTAHFSLLRSGF
jgi:hypothetical protein